jgi:adenylate cyclase
MVTPAAARAALDRVLASPVFANAGRLSRFLKFTVEQTLEGHADRLKEYVVGVEVFDRAETFDPRIDSIVRVEARRLRAKLAEYYEVEGAADTIVIRLQKGSYVPRFETRNGAGQAVGPVAPPLPVTTSPEPRRSARGPLLVPIALSAVALVALVTWWMVGRRTARDVSVAVLPFAHFSTDPQQQTLADRLTDGVIAELARFPALAVRSRTSVMQYRGASRPLRDIARALDADVVMEASVTFRDDQVRVEARLVRASSDTKFWVDDFSGPAADLPALERRIARAAATAIDTRRR